jgi:hypothetical protein
VDDRLLDAIDNEQELSPFSEDEEAVAYAFFASCPKLITLRILKYHGSYKFSVTRNIDGTFKDFTDGSDELEEWNGYKVTSRFL